MANKKRAARFAAALLTAALLTQLSSCSVIKINYEKFGFGRETATADASANATERPRDPGEVTEFVPPDEYEYTGKETAERLLSEVDYDFEGKSVIIRSTYEYGIKRIMSFTEEDTDVYSVARYERCRMIEEKLGCKLSYAVTTPDEMKVNLRAAVRDEKYYADLLALPAEDMTSLAKSGLLLNLYSLPFFELDEEYFHAATSDLAAGSDAYGVMSWATLDPDEIPCVFYDTKRVASDPTSAVKAGQWTWDDMLALAGVGGIVVAEGKDGNADAERLAELAAAGAGLRFVSNERGEAPTVMLPDGAAAAAEACRRLLTSGVTIPSEGNTEFAAGNAALYIGDLGDMASLANADVDWGVLPIPNMTSGKATYSALMPETSLFLCVPANIADPEGTSALLRAFAAASYEYIADAYEEYSMYRSIRIESAVDMIDIILGTAYFDFTHVYGSLGDSIGEASYGVVRDAATDGKADIESLFSRRRKSANRALAGLFSAR